MAAFQGEWNVGDRALQATSANWRSEVEESPIPVLVDFTAAWCPPCRALAPTIDGLAADLAGRVKVVTVDVDAEPELAERYGVQAMPTLLLLDHGRVLEQRIGAAPRATIEAFVLPHAAALAGA